MLVHYILVMVVAKQIGMLCLSARHDVVLLMAVMVATEQTLSTVNPANFRSWRRLGYFDCAL
jgi:hypothetical protein